MDFQYHTECMPALIIHGLTKMVPGHYDTEWNENISFFLIDQNGKLVAYVGESKNENYKKGEMIGTFEKTSLPNVYRVSWKKKDQNIDETTAYFDEQGNLKIDIHRNGKIEVITFSKE